jgi:hypothetical protein
MQRYSSFGRAVKMLALAAILSQSAAAAPDILRDYRFIPSHSSVHVTGGFAGVDWDLAIAGRFGLVTGYENSDSPLPVLRPYARFVDVNAILYNPLSLAPRPVPGWDLDDTLNLSGLDGTFRLGEPERLFFEGVDGQGAPIRLQAVMRDPLIRIVGANNPNCDGCADFFGYEIDAVGIMRKRADFNADGVVDAADFIAWRTLAPSSVMSDNGEVIEIGPAEYLDLWRAEFGQVTSGDIGSAAASFSAAAAPEPQALAQVLAAGLLLGSRRARSRRWAS